MEGDQLAAYIQQQVAAQVAVQLAEHEQQQAAAAAAAAPAPAPAPAPPAILKPTTPISFSGDLNEDVTLWLWQVDKWLQAGRVLHEFERIILATGLLRGPALAWWRNREQEPGHPITWANLQTEMIATFQPVNPVESYRDQLQTLRQTTSVLAYATAFRNIVVNLTTMTDEEKKYRFIYGLKPRTREEVRMRNPDTFEAAVAQAVRFDAVMRPGQRYGGHNYHGSEPTPMELGAIMAAERVAPPNMAQLNMAGTNQPGFRQPQNQRLHPNGQRPNGRYPNGQRYPNGVRFRSQMPKISYEQRQQLMKENKCFKCHRTGHGWRTCPQNK